VVIPDGSFLTANEEQNSDLYWAIRGGGGSTFGVVTSAIIAAYPRVQVATASYSLTNRSPDTAAVFWAGVREFYQSFASNADSGHYVVYRHACNLPTQPWNCTLSTIPHWANNMNVSQLQAYLRPYFARLSSLGVAVVGPTWADYPSVWAAFNSSFGGSQQPGSTTGTTHPASRIFPRRNWEDPASFNATFAAIRETVESTSGRIQGFNIKAAPNSRVNQSNAAHPAWRDTLLFAFMANPWDADNVTVDTIAAHNKQLVERSQPWRDVSPGGGSYMNEGDINEPNFQDAFFGGNYARLYALKQRYDPTGTLYAATAVGSEDWYVTDQIPYYPTSNGRLCRRK
jgi:FAD/FMN-containing dehydrogenase